MKNASVVAPRDCLICGYHEERDTKNFSRHIKKSHGLNSEQYTVKYLLRGVEPACPVCGARPRYTNAYSFKTYCINHFHVAESLGGKVGGMATAWNKGKTSKDDARIKVLKGADNPFYGKHHSSRAKKLIANSKLLPKTEFISRTTKQGQFECLTPYEKYVSRQEQKLSFRCLTCLNVIEHTLFNFEKNPLCKHCHPSGSVKQKEIADFISSLGFDVIYNDRSALNGKELDIYVPSKAFAIEYDSFYYHSYDENDRRKDRHHQKTVLCDEKGITLFHVFQDEWESKRDIIKSMIASRLGVSNRKIHARKCTVKMIPTAVAKKFFDANHAAGWAPAGLGTIGLFLNDELVTALSLRIPRQKKHTQLKMIEICRFASVLNANVVGGLSKLMKAVVALAKQHAFESILTYADLRYGKGKCYSAVGFTYVGWTGLSYDYNDGVRRYGRFKFRATKTMTENEVAKAAGVRRIYGCGNSRFKLDI